MDLIYEVKKTIYGSNNFHSIIGDYINIGENGENLTIVILSFNRSKSTIKLLNSIVDNIENYAGNILIYDNNSDNKEKKILKEVIKNMSLNVDLIESKNNKGVAGGRNAAIDCVKTDWIMSLDNDIYLIKNPLKILRKNIATLGCKFINLPLLSETGDEVFSNGGHLYVSGSEDGIHVGGGSMFTVGKCEIDLEFEPSLGTFLLGGASVFNKKAFIECGKFDSNMFVGFEDTDFSIELFQRGYKVGNCGIFALIHDHYIDKNTNDIEYEKIRFSSKSIIESALYLEKKRNIKVWNKNVENWLIEKHQTLNSNEEITFTYKEKSKPKIALIVDVDGWAFSNISKQIIKNLSYKYDFKYIVMSNYDNIVQVLILAKDCDLIHFFWRSPISQIFSEHSYNYLKKMGIKEPKKYLKKLLKNNNISTSVYDHLFLDEAGLNYTKEILKNSNNYYVSSKKLLNIYKNIDNIKKPNLVISDGVDLELFYPQNIERLNNIKNRNLVIGWVGNSKWSNEIEDFKGVNTILKPVLEELIKEKYPIEIYFADRNENMIPHDEMNEYYSKIDLYICPSKIEGTPNPILESMACGIPIISTDVGIVPEVFGSLQKKYILKKRDKKHLKKAIIELLSNLDKIKELSSENLKQIKSWDWKIRTEEFDKYFDECLKGMKIK